MIVLTVVAVVFVLAGTIGCLSTWALEASLMDRADIRVQAASQRGNTRRHSESTEKTSPSSYCKPTAVTAATITHPPA